jgi:hypothetical protein
MYSHENRAKSQKPSSFFPLGFDGNAYPCIAMIFAGKWL